MARKRKNYKRKGLVKTYNQRGRGIKRKNKTGTRKVKIIICRKVKKNNKRKK